MVALRQEQNRFVVDFTEPGDTRKRRFFRDKKEASAFRLRIESELSNGSYRSAAHSKSVSDLVKRFDAELSKQVKREEISSGHARNVRSHLNRLSGHPLFRLRLAHVTSGQVSLYADTLRNGGMSATTCRRHITSLRGLFAYGQRLDWLSSNPADAIVIRSPRSEQSREIECPSSSEIQTLFAACNDPALRIRVLFAASTGLRASEMRALLWSDISDGRVHVTKAMDRDGVVTPPRSKAGTRSVPLPAALQSELKTWRLLSRSEDRIFSGEFDNQDRLRDAFKSLCLACGLTEYNWHSLRHAYVTTLLSNGVAVPLVSQLAGHASFSVTVSTYAHLLRDQGDNHLAALDTIFQN